MNCTCRLAVIIAVVVWKADSIVTAFFLVFAFNHSGVVFPFAFTLLAAVTGVPLFIELQKKKEKLHLKVCVHACTHIRTHFLVWWFEFEDHREQKNTPGIFCHYCPHSHTARWEHTFSHSTQTLHHMHILVCKAGCHCRLVGRLGIHR